jgi:hypothetical protein
MYLNYRKSLLNQKYDKAYYLISQFYLLIQQGEGNTLLTKMPLNSNLTNSFSGISYLLANLTPVP